MKKKNLWIFIFLIIGMIYFVSADDNCTINWQCTSWSGCINEIQIRSCVDISNCGDNSTKSFENQSCASSCISNWNCTLWQPEKCPVDRIQDRICTDLNNCESKRRPIETKLCTYEKDLNLLFIFIVILISLMIIGDFILIISFWRKNKS